MPDVELLHVDRHRLELIQLRRLRLHLSGPRLQFGESGVELSRKLPVLRLGHDLIQSQQTHFLR